MDSRDLISLVLDSTDELEELDSLNSTTSTSTSTESSSTAPEEHYKCVDFVNTIDLYSEKDFKSHMRMQRTTVNFLIEKYSTSIIPKSHGGGKAMVDRKLQIYLFIWYVSNTVTFRQLGNLFGVAKSTAWAVVNSVACWMVSIGHEYVKWPQGTVAEDTMVKFLSKKNIPGVIGAIDCTHIQIKAPTQNKQDYFDRKHCYSLVLQGVVDADKRFTDITCGEPGSLHDCRVLRRSDLYNRIETEYSTLFPANSFILGDSAYPSTRWLVPPFKDYGNLTEQQKKFNKLHSSTRIVVENAFGLLKTRFRRLLHFTEQTNLCNVVNIIVSACVLHNICIIFDDLNIGETREDFTEESEENEQDELEEDSRNDNRRDELFQLLQQQNLI